MPMRKVLVGVTGAAIVVAAFTWAPSAPISGQHLLSTGCRPPAQSGNLRSDPFVAILRFPFILQAMKHYKEPGNQRICQEHAGSGTPLWRPLCILDRLVLRVRPDQARCQVSVGVSWRSHHHRPHAPGLLLWALATQRRRATSESNDTTGGTTESGIFGSRAGAQRHPYRPTAHRVSVLRDLSAFDDCATWLSPPPPS